MTAGIAALAGFGADRAADLVFGPDMLRRHTSSGPIAALDDALPDLDWVIITERPAGAIRLTPLKAAPEPRNLRRIKNEVARRWAAVPLIDVLKETVLRTGCLQAVTSVAGSGHLPPEMLAGLEVRWYPVSDDLGRSQ